MGTFESTKLSNMDLKNNIIGFHHISIKAKDFEHTVDFYKNFGFEIVHSWSLPDFNLEKCVMLHNRAINYYLEICDENGAIPTQGRKRRPDDEYIENALLHICFVVRDADAARKQALEYGAKDLSQGLFELDLSNNTKTVPVRNSLVYSPNGEVIEFLEKIDFG
ncbi:Glyoxalase-like domain protein [compost metagenome]|jgi:hypothetical protein